MYVSSICILFNENILTRINALIKHSKMATDTVVVWRLQIHLDGHLSTWWHLNQLVTQPSIVTSVIHCVTGLIPNLKIFAPGKYANKKTVTRFPLDSSPVISRGGWVGGDGGWDGCMGLGKWKGKINVIAPKLLSLNINTSTQKYLDP